MSKKFELPGTGNLEWIWSCSNIEEPNPRRPSVFGPFVHDLMDMAEQKMAVLIQGAICALVIHAQEKHCWVPKVVQIRPESIKTAAYKIENVLWVEEGRDLPEEALVPNCLVAEC